MVERQVLDHDVVMDNYTNQTSNHTSLVRDPNGALGGVLSGLAHQQGWDVSLVRLTFAAFALMSFGTAVFMYLLAWVVIPEANELGSGPAIVDAPVVNPGM